MTEPHEKNQTKGPLLPFQPVSRGHR